MFYVLVGVFCKCDDSIVLKAPYQYISLHGNWVPVSNIMLGDLVFCYVKTKDLTMYDKNASSIVGSYICSNSTFRLCGDVTDANFYDIVSEWPDLIYKQQPTIYSEKETINEKITQHHHLFVRPIEALSIVSKVRKDKDGYKYVKLYGPFAILVNMLRKINNIKSTHATFISYFLATSDWARKFLINLWLLCDEDVELFIRAIKYEGLAAKQVQRQVSDEMNMIFELNVLVNRLDNEVDWVKEKDNRTNIKCAVFEPNQIYDRAKFAFKYAQSSGQEPMKINWDDYWMRRYALTPNGAIHSVYNQDERYIKQIKHKYRSKKSVLSSISNFKHSELIGRKPQITAKTSTKYEWGKVRALYGCDITSHLNADFGLAMCEETLPPWMPVGEKATVENVDRIMVSMKRGIPFCYDYDDFNSQHSVQSMKEVILAWFDVYSYCLTDEQKKSVIWTYNSLNDMNVISEHANWRTKGTLFSGWRLTSFINTVLNWAYLSISGIDDCVMASIHNGDDVYAVVPDLSKAIDLIKETEKHDIRAQVSKMNIGTIAEFLRVDMRASHKTGAQYLTRACATMVHGRIETEAPNSAIDALSAINTRVAELTERGGNHMFAEHIKKTQCNVIKKLFVLDDNYEEIFNIDMTQGGLARAVPDGRIVKPKQTGIVDNQAVITVNLMKNGISDLQKAFARDLNIDVKEIDWSIMIKGAKRSLNVQKESYYISKDTSRIGQQLIEHAMKGAWSDSKGDDVHKMRHITKSIFNYKAFRYPGRSVVLAAANNPLHWLSLLV